MKGNHRTRSGGEALLRFAGRVFGPAFRDWFAGAGAAFVRECGLAPGHRVLDVGCGAGAYIVPILDATRPDGRVTGVDVDAAALATARELAGLAGAGERLRLVQGSILDYLAPAIPGMGLRAGREAGARRFDRIFLFDVLQHIGDHEALIRALAGVLPPGGEVYINPCLLGHPGRIDWERVAFLLFSAGFRPLWQRRRKIVHYKHVQEEDVFGFQAGGPGLRAFQARVFAAVFQVPPGRLTTYGAVARHIGCGSARAVGQALRRNPFAPLVPCHRVVRSDGRIGGFQGRETGEAVQRKIAMLAEEGIAVRDGRVLDMGAILARFE